MKSDLAALAALLFCTSTWVKPDEAIGSVVHSHDVVVRNSAGDPPDQMNVTVSPSDALGGLVFSPLSPAPAPVSVNTVTVRNNSNAPISNASVVVEVGPNTELCSATVLSGVTNTTGRVVLTLGGGGCAHNTALSGVIRVNGVTVRQYANVKSTDYDGAGSNLGVTLPDLTEFSREFGGDAPSRCHDYDNNGNTGLSDLIIFGAPFQQAASCAP